jgi:predicted deacetylase
MEYLLNRNGIIGLHGYTHQYGDEVSAVGTEFSDERNNDEKSIRKRVEAAINTAKKLELPVKFFETPHYAATAFQQSIFEQYFDIIYEPFVGIWGDRIVKSPRN